jgi:hypothetical protein
MNKRKDLKIGIDNSSREARALKMHSIKSKEKLNKSEELQ